MPAYKTCEVQRKGNTIFLIIYCVVPGGTRKTPLHVSTALSFIDHTCKTQLATNFSVIFFAKMVEPRPKK
jgi:hypothetical protein